MTPAQLGRLAEYHTAQHHPGPASGCAKCADQARRQRAGAKALRAARGHAAAARTDPRRPR